MIESIASVLNLFSTAAKAMNWFADIRKKTKGDVRALVEELKENSRLCFRVTEDHVPPEQIVPQFSTAVFDRLNEGGFDFDAVKRSSIPAFKGMEKTSLAFLAGESTARLIDNIYEKIKDVRSLHANPGKVNRRLVQRVSNINKRIALLLRHAKG